jgi:hypothetical protein
MYAGSKAGLELLARATSLIYRAPVQVNISVYLANTCVSSSMCCEQQEEREISYRLYNPTGLPSNSRDGRVVDSVGIGNMISHGTNIIHPNSRHAVC